MKFLIFFFSLNFILGGITYIYCRQNFAWARTWTAFFLYLLLSVNAIWVLYVPEAVPTWFLMIAAWAGGLWIAYLYYFIMIVALHTVLYIGSKLFRFSLPNHKMAIAGFAMVLSFVAWGTFQAFNPVVRTETITTDKLPANTNYRMVLVSDIHLGKILGKSYSQDLTERINAQQPDMVFMAGDMLDDEIRFVERHDSLSPLANIKAPLGVYAALGNHDYFDNTALWQEMLEENNIKVLRDASVIVNENLKISGLNDFSRNKTNKSLNRLSLGNENYYSILIDHQPHKIKPASEAGYDLYVAGHTHTGQLFPNRLITKKMYLLDYGRKEFGNMTAITSNGYGFWGPPVRTGLRPEIVVIDVKGK